MHFSHNFYLFIYFSLSLKLGKQVKNNDSVAERELVGGKLTLFHRKEKQRKEFLFPISIYTLMNSLSEFRSTKTDRTMRLVVKLRINCRQQQQLRWTNGQFN